LTSAPSLLSLVSGRPRCKKDTQKIKFWPVCMVKELTFLLALLGSGCAAAGGVVGGGASLQELIR
jgi:hypothetical protein